MHKRYKLIVLDMDGTIANTDEMIVQSMFKMYDLYNNGKRKTKEEIYYFSGPPIKDTLRKEFPTYDIDFLFEEFARISLEFYDDYIFPYPHEIETLTKLTNEGFVFAVVTNKIHSSALYCLKLLGLENIINILIGYDDVTHPKPHKEGIELALLKAGITDKNEAIYIGDNELDLNSADNARIDCALVNWGPRKLDPQLKCKYRLNDFRELENIVYEKN